MTEVRVAVEERPSTLSVAVRWIPRIAIALFFLAVGLDKFAPQSMWVRIFARIGVGQWFRYVTGALQIGGACLVLIPRAYLIGIAVLSCTMVGAILAWIFVLGAPQSAVVPGALLIILLAIGVMARNVGRLSRTEGAGTTREVSA